MSFIQCSLTGTALSWYIPLNDTYNQDWPAFLQAFEKKQISSPKNDYYPYPCQKGQRYISPFRP